MKVILAILGILAIVATAVPAAAQMGNKAGGGGGQRQEKKEDAKPKVDEKGYKSSLDRIPDQKYDPWGKVR
ncbi:MAG TPA: hypothetical protein VEK73_23205 [Xanthobacteraceae bacterium]|nr:hypothetical protein [Xanthobacteraceae bacterium]